MWLQHESAELLAATAAAVAVQLNFFSAQNNTLQWAMEKMPPSPRNGALWKWFVFQHLTTITWTHTHE